MSAFSVRAHFDGEHIRLDAPVTLEPNAKLLVTVLPEHDGERDAWLNLSAQGLAEAYGADEPEYGPEAIVDANPEYEAR